MVFERIGLPCDGTPVLVMPPRRLWTPALFCISLEPTSGSAAQTSAGTCAPGTHAAGGGVLGIAEELLTIHRAHARHVGGARPRCVAQAASGSNPAHKDGKNMFT